MYTTKISMFQEKVLFPSLGKTKELDPLEGASFSKKTTSISKGTFSLGSPNCLKREAKQNFEVLYL
jgi:hypothetical protein